jgi:hypothetical protein
MSRVLNVGGGSKVIPVPEHYGGWEHVLLDIDAGRMLYESPSGPITVNDVIYGHGRQIARPGNDFYAHKNAFSHASLGGALRAAGFQWVFMGAGPCEIRALALRQAPTSEQRSRLRLPS